MHQALDRYDRTFRLWNYDEFATWVRQGFTPNDRAALSAILGDFNGDHRPDMVINGRTRYDGVIVVLLSDSAGYRAVEVSRWPGDTSASGMSADVPGRDTWCQPRLDRLTCPYLIPPTAPGPRLTTRARRQGSASFACIMTRSP